MKFCIGLLGIIGLFFSCSPYVVNEDGYARPPKNYNFSYKKRVRNLTDTSIIDTNCLYYLSDSYYYKNNKNYKNGDAYIRFYANGRFKQQGFKKFPEIDKINSPDAGIVGYYLIRGGLVKMQIYGDINGGSNQLEYGYVDEGKNLIVMHENPRTDFNLGYNERKVKRLIEKSPFSPKIYKKIKIQGLKYIPPTW